MTPSPNFFLESTVKSKKKTVIEENEENIFQKKKAKVPSSNVLGLISCAMVIGICMQALQEDENVALVIRLVDGMNKLLMKAVRMIIWGWVRNLIIFLSYF